ncbi:MAG: HEPN domain-containing protein [Chthoniobacterales bacterium]
MASPLESDSSEAECLEWVRRGEWDWRSAHLLFEAKVPVLETACYHAQQAVEKILKAFLISRGAAAPRTHNLVALLDTAVEFEPSTADLKEACSLLTPYAVDLRYPGDIGVVEHIEAENALSMMDRAWSRLAALLPPESRALAQSLRGS